MRYLVIVALLISAPHARAAEQEWGTIKGQVVWGGDALPVQKPIEAVNKNQDKEHCLSKGPLLEEEWVVNKANKGIRWTFVWLQPTAAGAKLPIHPDLEKIKDKEVILDQPCCAFVPHALALRQGQELVAKNSAPVPHNINWTGGLKNQGNNLTLPPGKSFAIKDLVADKYPVKVVCNIHPWMNGWVRIFDHPYFAVTDADGKFEMKNAPAGAYGLVVWHGSVGYRGGASGRNGMPITIKANAVTDLGKLDLKP